MREMAFHSVIDGLLDAAKNVTADYRAIDKGYAPRELALPERIYCYELYHQYRKANANRQGILLHAELFKGGYPKFKNTDIDHKTPDFLFHTPGGDENNIAIVEVKSISNSLEELRGDIRKIKSFVDCAKYFGGLLLVFSDAEKKKPPLEELRVFANSEGFTAKNLVIAFDHNGSITRQI